MTHRQMNKQKSAVLVKIIRLTIERSRTSGASYASKDKEISRLILKGIYLDRLIKENKKR